jgi:hypothetical protein
MRSFSISGLALLTMVAGVAGVAAVACGTHGSSSGDNSPGSGSNSVDQSGGSSSTSTTHVQGGTGSSTSSGTNASMSSSTRAGSGDGGSSSDGSAPATTLPALHVEGNHIVDANGKTVVLRGVAIPDIGQLFSQGGGIAGVTGRIDEILGPAGLGIRAVRLPVYPRTVVNGKNPDYSPVPYPVGPASPRGGAMALSASDYIAQVLQPAVDYATSKNLYAIVDYHQIDNVTTGTSSADAVTFWTTVSPVFANYPNVIYEAFNEPMDTQTDAGTTGITSAGAWTSDFTTAAQSWITAIRGGAPNTVIIVGSPSWSQYPDGALTAGLTGGNLVFTAHIYPGNWPGSNNGFQTRVANAAMTVPVAITEWGYQIGTASNLATPDDTWAQSLQSFVESGGESWTAWVADPSWGPPMFTRATGGSANSFNGLTDFGTFVQGWLAGGSGSSDGGTDQ